MCGIFLYSSLSDIHEEDKASLERRFKTLQHRGPDMTSINYFPRVMLGFHRLQVVDNTPKGMMPFYSRNGRFALIMNGEIYNHKELYQSLKKSDENCFTPISSSDCEVVVHLFENIFLREEKHASTGAEEDNNRLLFTMKELARRLDGEFALIIYDKKSGKVVFATDELRVRPLFAAFDPNSSFFLASEQKALAGLKNVFPVPAATVGVFSLLESPNSKVKRAKIEPQSSEASKTHSSGPDSPKTKEDAIFTLQTDVHFDFNNYKAMSHFEEISFAQAAKKLRSLLTDNVVRKLGSDREFGFLLSGGLDSSLICAIAARALAPKKIRTFSFAFSEDAPDAKAALLVAEHLGSIHKTYTFSFDEGVELLKSQVIRFGETWDQTTVRASTSMLLGIKRIKKDFPELAVLFSGEVSDELLRGYLYNLNSPSPLEGRMDVIDRLENITYFDGLRADRMTSAASIELRLPFFGKDLLRFVLSLPPALLDPKANGGVEKKLLREAFSDHLPAVLLNRTKNALSDATSAKSGWKDHLKEVARKEIDESRFQKRRELYPFSPPQTPEDFWYRELFESFGYEAKAVPYKWMPKWCGKDLQDSSATVLSVFHESASTV